MHLRQLFCSAGVHTISVESLLAGLLGRPLLVARGRNIYPLRLKLASVCKVRNRETHSLVVLFARNQDSPRYVLCRRGPVTLRPGKSLNIIVYVV